MAQPGPSTMEVEEEKLKDRDVEIGKLLSIVEIIIRSAGMHAGAIDGLLREKIIDMEYSDDIAGTLMTVFTCLRKEENDKAGFNRYLNYTSNVGDAVISIKDIVDKIKTRKIELNFLVATPIVEIMTLYKASFDEVRTGVTRFKVRSALAKKAPKRDAQGRLMPQAQSKEVTQNITSYGLNNHHIPLLQGITFAPERRTGVLRSLGPMAQAILLVMEDKYHSKLTSALYNSIMMLPMAQEVVNVLRDAKTPGSVSGIMKELGDILTITTARSTQKIYFPILMIYAMWSHNLSAKYSWSFSGAAMLKFYNAFIEDGWKFQMKTGGDASKCSEVIFHAMFGTYLEDLTVLSQVTDNKATWHKRKDLNSVFLKRSSYNPKIIPLIKFTMVSKMAQSLLTKNLGNVDPCCTSRPSFSGFRTRTYTQEFLSYLSTGKSSHSFSNDPVQLQYALKKTKDTLMEDLSSTKALAAGTKEWEEYVEGQWVTSAKVVVEGSSKFFGV